MSTIKENLLKMKNLSELMTDLAYSAVFLRDKTITAEVEALYKQLRVLEEGTLKMLFRIRTPEEERIWMIDMMDSISEIGHCALRLADLTKVAAYPTIIRDVLKATDKRVLTESVARRSQLANRTIGESDVETKTKVRILAVMRKGRWNFKITRDLLLKPGDMIVAIGTAHAEKELHKLASG